MYSIDLPERRLAAVAHRGAFTEIGHAFERIGAILTARGLWPHVRGMMGVYYDDPHATPEAELRSHAGAILAHDAAIPDTLEKVPLPGGRCVVLHHRGLFAGLQAAYDRLYGEWLPKSGEEPADSPVSELYLNAPSDTPPEDLRTDISLC